jgi:hypothetical protein
MQRPSPEVNGERDTGIPKRRGRGNLPPPLDLELDAVDGKVVYSESLGSPHARSPQQLSTPHTPLSLNVSLDTTPSLPLTPLKNAASELVEVLASGTMRTKSSPWFDGSAWFPASMHAMHVDSGDASAYVQVLLLGSSWRDLEWVPLDRVRRVKRAGKKAPTCCTGEAVELAEVLGTMRVWYKGRVVAPPAGREEGEASAGASGGDRSSGGDGVWVRLGDDDNGPLVWLRTGTGADASSRLRRAPTWDPLSEQSAREILEGHAPPGDGELLAHAAGAAGAAAGGAAVAAGGAVAALDDLQRFGDADEAWVTDWEAQLCVPRAPAHARAQPEPLDVRALAELFCEREAAQLCALAAAPDLEDAVTDAAGCGWTALAPGGAAHVAHALLERLEVVGALQRAQAAAMLLAAALDLRRGNPRAAAAVRAELGCAAVLDAVALALAGAVRDLGPPSLERRGLSSVGSAAPGAEDEGEGGAQGSADDSSEAEEDEETDGASGADARAAWAVRVEVGALLNLLFVVLGELKSAASRPAGDAPADGPAADAGARARREALAGAVLAAPCGNGSDGRGGVPALLARLLERAGEAPKRCAASPSAGAGARPRLPDRPGRPPPPLPPVLNGLVSSLLLY